MLNSPFENYRLAKHTIKYNSGNWSFIQRLHSSNGCWGKPKTTFALYRNPLSTRSYVPAKSRPIMAARVDTAFGDCVSDAISITKFLTPTKLPAILRHGKPPVCSLLIISTNTALSLLVKTFWRFDDFLRWLVTFVKKGSAQTFWQWRKNSKWRLYYSVSMLIYLFIEKMIATNEANFFKYVCIQVRSLIRKNKFQPRKGTFYAKLCHKCSYHNFSILSQLQFELHWCSWHSGYTR